jgi:hypothetical protein
MEHGRETQSPYESDNPFIYKQLKLIRFRHNPLKMSPKNFKRDFSVGLAASPPWGAPSGEGSWRWGR